MLLTISVPAKITIKHDEKMYFTDYFKALLNSSIDLVEINYSISIKHFIIVLTFFLKLIPFQCFECTYKGKDSGIVGLASPPREFVKLLMLVLPLKLHLL